MPSAPPIISTACSRGRSPKIPGGSGPLRRRPLPSGAHAMPLPRFIDIDGKRYLVALRRAQATPKQEQPTLFEIREDCRPAGERGAADRYREPTLFTLLE